MNDKKTDVDETYMALKYPDYHTWRDLDAALRRGGYWPDKQPVRLSDPEMKPKMDELRDRIENDPEYARSFLRDLDLLPKHNYDNK